MQNTPPDFIPLYYTLHNTPPHFAALYYTYYTQCTTLHCTVLSTVQNITQLFIVLYNTHTPLHFIAQYYTLLIFAPHCTALHCTMHTAQYCITLHCTVLNTLTILNHTSLHCTTHCITLPHTSLHCNTHTTNA